MVGPNARRRLDEEVLAWQWALERAIVAPTPGVWAMIARCLESYVKRAALAVDEAAARRSRLLVAARARAPGRATMSVMGDSPKAGAVVEAVLAFESLSLDANGSRRAIVRWSDGSEGEALRWYDR